MGSEEQKLTTEMNEYLSRVIEGKVLVEGVEQTVVNRWKQDDSESKQLEQAVSQLTQQLDGVRLRLLHLQGKKEAYIQLLVDEELARKKKKNIADPTKIQIKGSILSEDEKNTLGDVLGMPIAEARVVPANMVKRKEF